MASSRFSPQALAQAQAQAGECSVLTRRCRTSTRACVAAASLFKLWLRTPRTSRFAEVAPLPGRTPYPPRQGCLSVGKGVLPGSGEGLGSQRKQKVTFAIVKLELNFTILAKRTRPLRLAMLDSSTTVKSFPFLKSYDQRLKPTPKSLLPRYKINTRGHQLRKTILIRMATDVAHSCKT